MAAARCVFCNHELDYAQLALAGGQAHCPGCRRSSAVIALPALLENKGVKPPPLIEAPVEGEAACFYSPNRRATRECSHCGVLISEVWAAQWGSKTVCLKCLDHLREKAKDQRFQQSRVLWDNIALLLAVLPCTMILWWAVFFTAPAAIFIALWHWNSQRSLVPRSRLRLITALLLGLGQVGGIGFLLCGWWFGWFK